MYTTQTRYKNCLLSGAVNIGFVFLVVLVAA